MTAFIPPIVVYIMAIVLNIRLSGEFWILKFIGQKSIRELILHGFFFDQKNFSPTERNTLLNIIKQAVTLIFVTVESDRAVKYDRAIIWKHIQIIPKNNIIRITTLLPLNRRSM